MVSENCVSRSQSYMLRWQKTQRYEIDNTEQQRAPEFVKLK